VLRRRWLLLGIISICLSSPLGDQPDSALAATATLPTTPTPDNDNVGPRAADEEPCNPGIAVAGTRPATGRAPSPFVFSSPEAEGRRLSGPYSAPPGDAPLSVRILTDGRQQPTELVADGLGSFTGSVQEGRIRVLSTPGAMQVLVTTHHVGSVLSLSFEHDLHCPRDSRLALTENNGLVELRAVGPAGGEILAWVDRPWAFDRTGAPVRTWFEIDGSILRQFVDTTGAVAPVTFDPTYYTMSCVSGMHTELNAYTYLDFSRSDQPYCPVYGMFAGRHGYFPSRAFETNVANDFGLVIVKPKGSCSTWLATDTGPYWDFQVPCKAHDYCYDLRRAGFSGTVSDGACDDAFWYLMEAHCNDRVLAEDCRDVRDNYYSGVRLPGVVADPSPAALTLQTWHLAQPQCMDVGGMSQADNAPIVQWPCSGTANQRFRITPASGHPGKFKLVAEHSKKCVDINIFNSNVAQWSCNPYDQQVFNVRAEGSVTVTLRSKFHNYGWCIDVPGASRELVQLIEYPCHGGANQLWHIV
jgi:hypothetical protein